MERRGRSKPRLQGYKASGYASSQTKEQLSSDRFGIAGKQIREPSDLIRAHRQKTNTADEVSTSQASAQRVVKNPRTNEKPRQHILLSQYWIIRPNMNRLTVQVGLR